MCVIQKLLFRILKHYAPVELCLTFNECRISTDCLDDQTILRNIVLRAENIQNILNSLLAEILVAHLSACVLVSISCEHKCSVSILLDHILDVEVEVELLLGIEFGLADSEEHSTRRYGELLGFSCSKGVLEIFILCLQRLVYPQTRLSGYSLPPHCMEHIPQGHW